MYNVSREQTVDLLCDLHAFGQGTNGKDTDPPREEIRCHELGCFFLSKGGSINDSLQLHGEKEAIAQKGKKTCSTCLWQMG